MWLGLVVRAGDWLIGSRLGRWVLLAGAAFVAALLWKRSIVSETRRELDLQAERRANSVRRRMLDAAVRGPVTDDDLVARLRRGGGL
jgi:hypothetical protein